MQRILNALVQYRSLILFLFLLMISLAFINGNSVFHSNKLSQYGFYFSYRFQSFTHKVDRYFKLTQTNQNLLEENRRLKALELKSNALALYPEALMIQKIRFPYKVVEANVIKSSFQSQRNYTIIDQGYASGITPEMAVISKDGIVGFVQGVSKNYANVISVLHQDVKINVRIKNRSAFGSLRWKGQHPQDFQIDDIVTSAKVQMGDTLVTGGMSSYFPMGIPLGKIIQLDSSKRDGYFQIDVKLFEDPSQVQYVYVLENIDRDEIQEITQKSKP